MTISITRHPGFYAAVTDIGRLAAAAVLAVALGAAPGAAQAVNDFQARSQRISASKSLPYRLFVPKNYKAGTRYALMITLHGAGERGSDNAAQLNHDFSKRWAADSVQAVRPCFVVAPQCPVNNQWTDVEWAKGSYDQTKQPISDELQAVVDILDSLGKEFTLDADRVYVSGLSMGGFGTWDLITRHPDRFAAAVPVCGAADPKRAPALSKLPVWVFHAEDDNVIPVSGSRDMVNALKAAGLQPKYTEYPKAMAIGHSSWVPAGKDPGLTPWLFAQARASTALAPQARRSVPGNRAWTLRQGRFETSLGGGPMLVVDASGRLRRAY